MTPSTSRCRPGPPIGGALLLLLMAIFIAPAMGAPNDSPTPLDFVATTLDAREVIETLQSRLVELSAARASGSGTLTIQEFRQRMSSWRLPSDEALDLEFRKAMARVDEGGHPFVMRPVMGDRFPVRAVFFRDQSFFLADDIDQTHLLLSCQAGREVITATGTQSPWRVSIGFNPDQPPLLIRVFVFNGFVGKDRQNVVSKEELRDCLASVAKKRSAIRRFGDAEKSYIQEVHDFFFDVRRSPPAPDLQQVRLGGRWIGSNAAAEG